MGEILKLPFQATKLGYRRVRKRAARRIVEDHSQLDLFAQPQAGAQILNFTDGLGLFEQALLSDERGDERAAELYAAAIREEDCVADAYCNLGVLESHKGNNLKAFDCFSTSLKTNPRHSEAHYNLGNLYFEQNEFGLAQLHYEMAVEVDPDFANAYFNLALILTVNNDVAGMTKAFGRYQSLVTPEESRIGREIMEDLKKSFATAARDSKARSS